MKHSLALEDTQLSLLHWSAHLSAFLNMGQTATAEVELNQHAFASPPHRTYFQCKAVNEKRPLSELWRAILLIYFTCRGIYVII